MIQVTRTTPSFKSKKVILKHPSEWIIVEGTHKAIIDDVLWYAAEEKRLEMAVKIIARAKEARTDSRSEMEKERNRNKMRLEEIARISRSMYEDRVAGLISTEMFVQMTSEYKTETDECKENIRRIESKLGQIESIEKSAGKWIDVVCEYLNLNKLDQEMVHELVEKIEVSHVSGSNSAPKKVTIYYKFLGPISGSKLVISGITRESRTA